MGRWWYRVQEWLALGESLRVSGPDEGRLGWVRWPWRPMDCRIRLHSSHIVGAGRACGLASARYSGKNRRLVGHTLEISMSHMNMKWMLVGLAFAAQACGGGDLGDVRGRFEERAWL